MDMPEAARDPEQDRAETGGHMRERIENMRTIHLTA
jgi:hypothetical protein